MKNFTLPFMLAVLILVSAVTPLRASGQDGAPKVAFKGFSTEGKRLDFNFEIPLDGVVELVLMDSSGKIVYRDNMVATKGEGKISVGRGGFTWGESYTYRLNYKMSEHSGPIPAEYATLP